MKQSQCGRENKHPTRAKQRVQKKGGRRGAALRQGMVPNGEGGETAKGEAWWQLPVCRRKPCPLRGHRVVGHCCHFLGWDIMSQADPEHKQHLKSCASSCWQQISYPLFAHKSTCHPQPSGQELFVLPWGKGRSWNVSWDPGRFCQELYMLSCEHTKRRRRNKPAWSTACHFWQPLPKSLFSFQKAMSENSNVQCSLKEKCCLLRAEVDGLG